MLLLFSWLLFFWHSISARKRAAAGRPKKGEASGGQGFHFFWRGGGMAEESIWTGLTPGHAWSAFM